jgi:hypothetical protein
MARPTISLLPPAENGTTNLMGLVSCAITTENSEDRPVKVIPKTKPTIFLLRIIIYLPMN